VLSRQVPRPAVDAQHERRHARRLGNDRGDLGRRARAAGPARPRGRQSPE
jgi:hypothetical protein